jgi:hypothetical protein
MNARLMKKSGIRSVSIGVFVCFSLALAQGLPPCVTGPVQIVCHSDPGFDVHKCCGWLPLMGCDTRQVYDPPFGWVVVGSPGTDGRNIKNPVVAYVLTCGAGSSSATASAFTGLCSWNESGSNCGTPWGPVPKDASVSLYGCEGDCGGY